jgi:DNA-binding MarR family transcriptional regulator
MDPAPGGADLERLLAVLLRMLSPAAVAPGSGPGGNDHADAPASGTPAQASTAMGRTGSAGAAHAGTVPGGTGSAGPAQAGTAPDGTGPGGPAQASTAPGGTGPGGTGPGGGAVAGAPAGPGGAAAGAPAVTASEARALTELLAAHGIAQGQLAALLGLEKSTVSRLAAGLESKGWIRRGRDERNHRYVRLYLTPQGRAVADRLWQAWQSRQARILAGLTAEERAGLATGLRGVLRGLAAEGLLAAPPPLNGQS